MKLSESLAKARLKEATIGPEDNKYIRPTTFAEDIGLNLGDFIETLKEQPIVKMANAAMKTVGSPMESMEMAGYPWLMGKADKGYRAGKLTDLPETLENMSMGRSTGHFGTGLYYFGDPVKADKYAKSSGRSTVEVPLEGKNMWLPENYDDGERLHRYLRDINESAWGGGKSYIGWSEKKSPTDFRFLSVMLEARGVKVSPKQIEEAVKAAHKDIKQRKFKTETASTRVMKMAGFDGVDVRGVPELDRSDFGSVLYK